MQGTARAYQGQSLNFKFDLNEAARPESQGGLLKERSSYYFPNENRGSWAALGEQAPGTWAKPRLPGDDEYYVASGKQAGSGCVALV